MRSNSFPTSPTFILMLSNRNHSEKFACWVLTVALTICGVCAADLPVANPASMIATPPGSIVVNSSDVVEMEKLRMTKEAAKLEREEAEFKEGVLKLQKKLMDA